MSILRKHLPALRRLEKRVENQEFLIEQNHIKAQKVLEKFKKLERLIIKNFGEKSGEEFIEKVLKPHWEFINSRISLNHFDEVEDRIKRIEAQVKEIALSHSGAFFH